MKTGPFYIATLPPGLCRRGSGSPPGYPGLCRGPPGFSVMLRDSSGTPPWLSGLSPGIVTEPARSSASTPGSIGVYRESAGLLRITAGLTSGISVITPCLVRICSGRGCKFQNHPGASRRTPEKTIRNSGLCRGLPAMSGALPAHM